MTNTTGFIQLGFYGLTADEFKSAFANEPQRFNNEFIDYYKLHLFIRITRLSREHDLTLITTLRDGANDWLSEKVSRMNMAEPLGFIPREVVVPKDPSPVPPTEIEWSILKGADQLIHADGNDEDALQRRLLDVSEKLILATFDPEKHPLYRMAKERDIPVDCWNPKDTIQTYIHARENVNSGAG